MRIFTDIRSQSDPETQQKPNRRNSSRIRDHLANERTYLAWMRTAIALMGFGVLIARIRLFQSSNFYPPGNGWKIGFSFAIVGLLTVLLSTQHYFAIRKDIDEDTYEPTDRWVILFSLSILVLGTGAIYYFFTVSPSHLSSSINP